MNVAVAYLGKSRMRSEKGARILQFAPNLKRPPVAFDASLSNPVRFREAVSALHEVVISDLKFKPRDKTAYREWKKGESERMNALRRDEYRRIKKILENQPDIPLRPGLESDYRKCTKRYWKARRAYNRYLKKHDPKLWRLLVPLDPVITVAEDVVFFECFSADESSYGCLSVGREDGFGAAGNVATGTTNVDYSWDLYNHFQGLRSYRDTRLNIDPAGFEVQTEGLAQYKEEKIDLPPGWLRGFMQIQSAMTMPMHKVSLTREAVYSLLAWLKRHRARKSPRAVRFELLDGKAPRLVVEPWEKIIDSHGTQYEGPGREPIRIWGRRRLLALSRLLPLADGIDVYLLGTGLPSFWVIRMGEQYFTLGLSGWTANDWTRGSALDLMAHSALPSKSWIRKGSAYLSDRGAATFKEIKRHIGLPDTAVSSILAHLAHTGQVIYDLEAGRYRRRQVMPMPLGEAEMGPPNPELAASRELVDKNKVRTTSRRDIDDGGFLLEGSVENNAVEILCDGDFRIRRGTCGCSHYRKFGLRNGPCRHMLAIRYTASQ